MLNNLDYSGIRNGTVEGRGSKPVTAKVRKEHQAQKDSSH